MIRLLPAALIWPGVALAYNESDVDRAYRYYLAAEPMRTDPTQAVLAGLLCLAGIATWWIVKRHKDR